MMKARRLNEVRQLASSPEFKGWWDGLLKVRQARDDARERHEELLSQAMLMDFRAELAQKNAIDTLYRAGELEDSAAKMAVEAQELDNTSFKVVADFEEQRIHASEIWYRACAAERQAEALREDVAARRQRLAAPLGPAQKKEIEAEIARVEAELKRVERAHVQLSQENERELAVKNRLWDEVEKIWARSMELALLMTERRTQGKKVRVEAQRLFKQAEDRKQRAHKLREEADTIAREQEAAEAKLAESLKQAGERFGCAQGDEFVYLRQKESPRRAWCVALVDDGQSYNIEVKPLAVYSIDQKRGVEFLEPAVEVRNSDAEGDRRFEEFFLTGRKGRAVEEPAASPERKPAG
ncbi:MAG: hypothetical protein HY901_33535 [Deltaproteobacteria bacterium]|nr:hypothetical protein [Deltaproteobacteria bacterium]